MAEKRAEERRKELMEKYDARWMQIGIELRGDDFLRSVHVADELDSDWAAARYEYIYGHMYDRRVLEPRIRGLIILAFVLAAGHDEQLPNQMLAAVNLGASPEEILEVIIQATTFVGQPVARKGTRTYRKVMSDLGLREFTEPPFKHYTGDSNDDDSG